MVQGGNELMQGEEESERDAQVTLQQLRRRGDEEEMIQGEGEEEELIQGG